MCGVGGLAELAGWEKCWHQGFGGEINGEAKSSYRLEVRVCLCQVMELLVLRVAGTGFGNVAHLNPLFVGTGCHLLNRNCACF